MRLANAMQVRAGDNEDVNRYTIQLRTRIKSVGRYLRMKGWHMRAGAGAQ